MEGLILIAILSLFVLNLILYKLMTLLEKRIDNTFEYVQHLDSTNDELIDVLKVINDTVYEDINNLETVVGIVGELDKELRRGKYEISSRR